MDRPQRSFISSNIKSLSSHTIVSSSPGFLQVFKKAGVLTEEEITDIKSEGKQNGVYKSSLKLYQTLITKKVACEVGYYETLISALTKTNQTEALEILQDCPKSKSKEPVLQKPSNEPKVSPKTKPNVPTSQKTTSKEPQGSSKPKTNVPVSQKTSIKESTGSPTLNSNALAPQEISYDKSRKLGNGSYGTIVYDGKFGSRVVAVKVVFDHGDDYKQVITEIDAMVKCDSHENVLRYHSYEQRKDPDSILLALEKCDTSLLDWVMSRDYETTSNLKRSVLHQAMNGLNHLHERQIIHRDLKPANILLSVDGTRVTAKIADFGISKFIIDDRSSATMTSVVGTEKWRAPEVLKFIDEKEKQRGSGTQAVPIKMDSATDIFSLGCVFYFVFTSGKHPFGVSSSEIRINILADAPQLNEKECDPAFLGSLPLIRQMTCKDATERPKAPHIQMHHLFWDEERSLQFLVDVSNVLEKRNEEKELCINNVESRYESITSNGEFGWISQKISPAVSEYLRTNKIRKYKGDSVIELVRAIRNMQNHYTNLPTNVQQAIGTIPVAFMEYWLSRFPLLINNVWLGFQDIKGQLPPKYYPEGFKFS